MSDETDQTKLSTPTSSSESDETGEAKLSTPTKSSDNIALAETSAKSPAEDAIDAEGRTGEVGKDVDGEAATVADTPSNTGDPSATSNDSPGDSLIGKRLAERYRVEKKIGHGGMGMVYRARHEALDKPVAIKVIRSDLAANELNVVRFEREAKAAASLDHEHVVDVIDYGHTDDGKAYMVMELLEGSPLDVENRRRGPLPAGRSTAIAYQIAKGLKEAHQAGVIHRDLKSPNVFLIDRDGRDLVKLLDFGISKISEVDSTDVQLTSTGMVMGTPNYLSPEQAKGAKDLDHRVDIYALGVIFYEMLTGELPFAGANVLELAYKHISEKPVPPSRKRPDLDIPRELDEIVLRCLAKNPDDRFQDAPAFIEALPDPATLSGGWTLASHIPGTSGSLHALPTTQSAFKHRMIIALLLGALVGGAVVVFFLMRHPPNVDATVVNEPSTAPVAALGSKLHDTGVATDGRPPAPSVDERDAAATNDGGAEKAHPVKIVILPFPAHATISLGGEEVGRGYQELELDRSDEPLPLVVKARGFKTVTRPLVPSKNLSITVELERRASTKNDRNDTSPGDGEDPQRPLPDPATENPTPLGVKANPYGSSDR